MSGLRHKRGAMFAATFHFADANGSAVDVTALAMAAELRDGSDTLVQTMPVVATGALGEAYTGERNTTAWPLGHLRLEVLLQTGQHIAVTETIAVQVVRQVVQ